MKCHLRAVFFLSLLTGFFLWAGCGGEDQEPIPLDPAENQTGDGDGDSGDGDGDSGDGDSDGDGEEPDPDNPVIDGEACSDQTHCQSNTCLPAPDWPDGYCTTVGCSTFEDCANEEGSDANKCLQNPRGDNFCIRICNPSTGEPCRSGYQCQPIGTAGDGWCAPNPNDISEIDQDFPFEVRCESTSNNTANINYEVSDDSSSYMMVPLTGGGGWLDPVNITTASGTTINFRQENSFQTAGAQLFGSVNPTVIPAAPQFGFQLDSGLHTYRLNTQDAEMCYFIIESSGPSTIIDLNIYLVGLDGITAANAASSPNLQAMLSHAESLYNQADISFGEVRYLSVSSEAESAYSTIRSQGDVGALASQSTYPGSDRESALSANIFLVNRFAFSGGGGVLGLSQGIPGVAGLHGTAISGVALTGQYMGYDLGGGINGNEFTANILAHELGHFLGLFHTSETNGGRFDPLEDTPECTDFSNPTGCPDWGNLMFPMADIRNDTVTPDQSYVIEVNPLTK